MSEDSIKFHAFLGAISDIYTSINAKHKLLEKDANRLLVLATKHCPKEHHDWDEVKKIGDREWTFLSHLPFEK